ncbi:MAG: hypothetical protein AAF356_10035 [Planctomycetota bacterium]
MRESTPMYVGYLPLPQRCKGAVLGAAAMVLLGAAALAGGLAASQRHPGDAVWDIAAERSWSGTLVLEPYPMLVDSEGVGWFVVGIGKFGVLDRVASYDGAAVIVRGYSLQRDHRRMIELSPDKGAIEPFGAHSGVTNSVAAPVREVAFVGEIVDGKCYLGAMKPGDGKAHKACATLCIEGGLPPLVAGEIPGAGGLYPLLRVDGHSVLPSEVLALVGEPVRIRGRLGEINGLPVLDIKAGDVEPAG